MLLRQRLPEDFPQVAHLLKEAALPLAGLDQTEGWVLESQGVLVAHVAVERTADAALLRSLVVAPAQRGQGLAALLMHRVEAMLDVPNLLLKTDTIGPWAERLGYRKVPLKHTPASVRTTTQFSGSTCSETPIYFKEKTMTHDTIKAAVRERYAGFVSRASGCGCGCSTSQGDPSLKLGYSLQDANAVPEGANLGLGCGNPVALASLKPGEVVLDLGSGAGFDAFLASPRVGPEGRVIGVDMTPEMIARARALAEAHGYTNVEFREGDIEHLPVEDSSIDVILSNCVVNLTTDKARTFREAYRVLKAGGRLMVSDLVLLKALPEALKTDMDAYAACLSGALKKEDYLAAIQAAGFLDLRVLGETSYDLNPPEDAPRNPAISPADLNAAAQAVVSIQVQASKPQAPAKESLPECCQSCCPTA